MLLFQEGFVSKESSIKNHGNNAESLSTHISMTLKDKIQTSMKEAMGAYDTLQSSSNFSFEITRRGKKMNLNHSSSEIWSLFRVMKGMWLSFLLFMAQTKQEQSDRILGLSIGIMVLVGLTYFLVGLRKKLSW